MDKINDDYEEYYETEKFADELIEAKEWEELLKWACDRDRCEDAEIVPKVMECYRICLNHNETKAIAAVNLGAYYYNGVYVPRDFKKAFELYKISADLGEIRAICNLGYCYYYGRDIDVDYKKAYECFNLGALLYNDSNCYYKLGDMYAKGLAKEKNEKYAYMLYRKANWFLTEDDQIEADVLFRLGKCFYNGIGTDADLKTAYDYFSQALCLFYERRKTDPFAGGLIASCKKYMNDIQKKLDEEIIDKL